MPASNVLDRRVVLLGASNLKLGLSSVISAAQAAWGRPLDIVAALGHGRGYGLESRVLGRVLPSILDCGVWSALETRQPAQTASLLTDIGNDLVYGAHPEQLLEWIEITLNRLRGISTQITISHLPRQNLERIGPWRYGIARTVIFPTSKLTFDQALERVGIVNASLTKLAESYGANLVAPEDDWYGFDPIHIRRSARHVAWHRMFSFWNETDQTDSAHRITDSSRYLHQLRPLRRVWFGMKQVQSQPAGLLKDGSTVSLY